MIDLVHVLTNVLQSQDPESMRTAQHGDKATPTQWIVIRVDVDSHLQYRYCVKINEHITRLRQTNANTTLEIDTF